MKINGRIFLFLLILVALATACKFFFGPTSWSGFSPVIAIAFFSGMIMKRKDFSFVLPLVAVFISDAVIQLLYEQGLFAYEGFYSGQWKNYLLLLLPATLLGWLIRGKSFKGLLFGGIASPTVFFLISNFSVWLSAEVLYSRDLGGLMNCYEAGLPFYRNALVGTLVFLPVILFAYNYLTRKKPVLTLA